MFTSSSRVTSRLSLLAFFTLFLQSNASPTLHAKSPEVHAQTPRIARSVQPVSVDSIVDTLLVGNGSSNPEMEAQMKGTTSTGVTVLSESEIDAFAPYTHYASTAYCDPSTTLTWNCGANCEANPSFQPIASGGNSGTIQFWYVGYDPTLDTVIVAHQGTDTSMLSAVATDAFFLFSPLNEDGLFPGVGLDLLVHSGFRLEHAKTAKDILSNVQTALTQFNTNKVTIVGHSLGAALALLEAVYLPLHLPSGTEFAMYGYGMPRVGNAAFADYIDANLSGVVRRVNNKKDLVPVIPLRLMGFVHPSGEKHITENGTWVTCAGQENTNAQCTLGAVPTIFNGDEGDHSGPYDGIEMGC